jgi:hypothetical protein
MHVHPKSFGTSLLLVTALFAISSSPSVAGDKDKDKSKPAPAAQPQPHPQPQPRPSNSGNAGASHVNTGGNSGRPANANTGRPGNGTFNPGGNSNVGKPTNNANSGIGKPNTVNTGKPNNTVNTGHPNNTVVTGNSGRSNSVNNAGRTGAPGGTSTTTAGPGYKGGGTGTTATNGKGTGAGTYEREKASGTSTHVAIDSRGPKISDSTHEGIRTHREATRVESHVGDKRILSDDRGHVRVINGHDSHGRDMVIHRDFHGAARFETRRPDGRRVVGYGHGRGFTQRAYIRPGGRVYVQRTYVYGGRRYAYAYRSYSYRGVVYYRYAPVYYYHPVFYGWAYNPWAAPVYYRWGWAGDPWYPYYGYYFAPYPYYPNASLWLTDYLLAENLRLAYEARANAEAEAAAAYSQNSPPQETQVTLTPEVKQMIAAEVQRQLAEERSAAEQAQSGPQAATATEETPPALDPNQRIFIVANNVDLATDQGECVVTAGDVLMRTGTAPNEQNKIGVNVVTSKKEDCPVNTNADIDVAELQEMHNQFREKLDSGLKTLAENQGKNGLPAAPNTQTVNGEVAPPQPDPDAASELEDQQKSAEQTEHEVQKPASPGAANISPALGKPAMTARR